MHINLGLSSICRIDIFPIYTCMYNGQIVHTGKIFPRNFRKEHQKQQFQPKIADIKFMSHAGLYVKSQ